MLVTIENLVRLILGYKTVRNCIMVACEIVIHVYLKQYRLVVRIYDADGERWRDMYM